MRVLMRAAFLGALMSVVWSVPVRAQERAMTVTEARAHMATMAREQGFWVASNAEYATEASGEPGEYRMQFTLSEDGYTMRGCMWAEVEGTERTFWRFFSAWDPGQHAIYQYQVHPSGIVGIGWQRPGPDGHFESVTSQFVPGAAPELGRHLNRVVNGNTLSSRSFDGMPDAWTLRRSYTWEWRSSTEEVPCA